MMVRYRHFRLSLAMKSVEQDQILSVILTTTCKMQEMWLNI